MAITSDFELINSEEQSSLDNKYGCAHSDICGWDSGGCSENDRCFIDHSC